MSVNVFANGSLFTDSGPMTSVDYLTVNGATIVNATSSGGTNNGAFTASATVSSLFANTPYLVYMNVVALAHPSGTATAFLEENPNPTEEEIRWALSGNNCRCTGYMNIVKAVQWAAKKMATSGVGARGSNPIPGIR